MIAYNSMKEFKANIDKEVFTLFDVNAKNCNMASPYFFGNNVLDGEEHGP